MKKDKISVVIPAYNEEKVISNVLESLKKQDYKEKFEIVVCDNGSTDDTALIAKAFGARVVHEKRKGTRFAYDTGIRESKGDIILVTNADIMVPNNWISSIVREYQDQNVVGVGTLVGYRNVPEYIRTFFNITQFFNFKPAMWGVSLSCRRWAFDEVGGFDHGVNTNEDAIFTLLLEKVGTVKIIKKPVVLMDGRRFNRGIIKSIWAWITGIGLNSLYIQFMYVLTGEIKTLTKDFKDVREEENNS